MKIVSFVGYKLSQISSKMKVLKFGGTSLGSATAIQNAIKAIHSEYTQNQSVIVVCSAMSGVTNVLQQLALDAAKGISDNTAIKNVEKLHAETVKNLINPDFQNEVLIFQKLIFNQIEEILESIAVLGEVSPKTNDRMLAYGEQLSTFMMTYIVRQEIGESIYVDTRKLIVTDSQFGNAKIDWAQTENNIKNWYEQIPSKSIISVATGFIASDHQGVTTTLGRGGSDYTASIFGAILNADEIQIWTDVDGFMTADPRLTPHAISLQQLSYAEAMELSYFGAKVIYPPTMIPVIEKQIPIVIKNTFNPEFSGTLIHSNSLIDNSFTKGIASISDVCLLNIEGSGLVGFKGFSGRLFQSLAQGGVNIIMITQASSEHSISFAVEPKDLEIAQQQIQKEFELEFLTKKIEKISVAEQVSIVAVVGENMKHSKGLAGKVFQALGRVGVNIMAIAQGSSELNISMVIQKTDLAKAVNAIHNDLFLSKTKNAHLLIAGMGNIGKTLLQQIDFQKDYLIQSLDLQLKLIGLTNSKKNLVATKNLIFTNWESSFEKSAVNDTFDVFIEKAIATNLPNLIFVDNTASAEVSSHYLTLLENNISVVTCNKIATSGKQSDYDLLRNTALKKGIHFLYETNVGAGLPIIKTLQDLIHSGDRILKVEAILSGTISYIFNNYNGNKTFASVVKEAQDKGYTEPNPVDDLSGKDFARKMLIIARETGLKLEMTDIGLHPILPESCLKAQNVSEFYELLQLNDAYFSDLKQKAEQMQSVLRYMGVLENNKVSLKVEMVNASHPFYNLSGSDNIIAITTQRYLNNPLVVKGPGAGAEVTAAGVFADIMRATDDL